MSNNKKFIHIEGARLHNLKNITVDIPRNRFTVITGVSGSGKSSLAFDTLYAEGQRRFVESLSAYARQFLERMHKPDADAITGLPPAVAIEQNVPTRNPRSTVGTSTEIYDYLRLLYGRIGKTYCKETGNLVTKETPASIVEKVLEMEEGAKLYILFPLPDEAVDLKEELPKYRSAGYFRIVIKNSNDIIDLEQEDIPDKLDPEDIYILADRLVLRYDADNVTRLTESIETAFRFGGERVLVRDIGKNEDFRFSGRFDDPESGIEYIEPEPKLFSFNNPFGACPHCQGFGRTIGIDDDLIFPDRSLSIEKNAIHPFKGEKLSKYRNDLIMIAPQYGIDVDAPIASLTDDQMEIVMDGAAGYIGVNGFFKMLEEKSYKMHYRIMLNKYRGYTKCYACGGSRLRTSARQVFVGGKNIPEIILMPLEKVLDFMNNLELTEYEQQVVSQVMEEITWRLRLLVDIGLEYLTLNRLNHTLSGGETQRINLSTALGSSLVGTLYVLDEPSIGMHPSDTQKLLKILFKLRDLGNTIVVVEHDPDIIKEADYIIDMGPHAGERGGEVIYRGPYEDMIKNEGSLTGQYISGRKMVEPAESSKPKMMLDENITIYNPRQNNLKMEKVEFPAGRMSVVTGVSGSGKSTLIKDVLYAGIRKQHGAFQDEVGKFEKISGGLSFDFVEMVDQSPIGRSSRSTPATYTKAFDKIRELFAGTQLGKQLGLKPGYFSFNVPGGRCEECEGEGYTKVDMQFLPDVTLECESCKGTRYKKEAREITYKDKNIVDVLDMTINDAIEFFGDEKKIVKKLSALQEVGLGYLRLGQPSTMLSGGESQRIKLAGHLISETGAESLFIFDEPTTGLHLDDISKLIKCFKRLIESGNTVIIIEHNLNIMAAADHIIDLGPGAGEFGGEIVATGTPKQIAQNKNSLTGNALKEYYRTVEV